ncbi:hypothetical protein CEXT_262071 [Caerostris extrusa]|uniref:Uncharacterized protein n=1 Tax=Caerostris extrusa TaxID=172846 RepID=A0AAV4RWA7_CAEEX|nr:hypothetical protein CEXT_262071 [Caerostris extrusa]
MEVSHLLRCPCSYPCFPQPEPDDLERRVSAAGPLGLGKGLIAVPAVATVSSQRTAINHVAPALAAIGAAARHCSPTDSSLETDSSPTDSLQTDLSPTDSSETEFSPTESSPETESSPTVLFAGHGIAGPLALWQRSSRSLLRSRSWKTRSWLLERLSCKMITTCLIWFKNINRINLFTSALWPFLIEFM